MAMIICNAHLNAGLIALLTTVWCFYAFFVIKILSLEKDVYF